MFTIEEQTFFTRVTVAAVELSNSSIKQGAIIVDSEKRISSDGYQIKPIESESWEISAIQNACMVSKVTPSV